MSSGPNQIPPTALALSKNAPYVGAMLRLTYQIARKRSLSALMERGFTDLNQSLLNAFFYPIAQGGMRPIDLAEKTNMTKQAMNYLIGQLEASGYLERRPGERGDRRLIHLTQRGWQVFETIWKAQIQLERDWKNQLGKKRFDEFMETLRQLSGIEKNELRKSTSARSDERRPGRA